MWRVLVTDCEDRKSLAAIRSLGARGLQVWAGGTGHLDQGFHSRHCAGRLVYPDPVRHFARFADCLLRFLRNGRCDIFLPMSDYSTLFACRHRRELQGCVNLIVPELDAFLAVSDKARMVELAHEAGVGVPETYCPDSADELRDLGRRITYPCVVKPRRGAGALGVRYPRSPEELMASWTAPRRDSDAVYCYDRPLVQEFIPGRVHSVGLLFGRGEPVAAVTLRHIRNVPPTGGRCVEVETTDMPEVRNAAVRLLTYLKWHGPAMMQFKLDDRDDMPKLLDLNGRFWGTLDTAIQAGVDFPWLTCRLAMGERVEPVAGYRVGMRYRWFVPYEFMYLMQSESRLKAAWNLFNAATGTRCDIRRDDLRPAAVEILRRAGGLLLRRKKAFRRGG